MVDFYIEPSKLQGNLIIPPSKSHTLRAIVFAALAKGESKIEQFLISPDTKAMIEAVCSLGAKVERRGSTLYVQGFAGEPKRAEDVIQCGNAGQVLRFIGALAGLIPEYTILTGDFSIRHQRPVQPLLHALEQLGVFAVSSRGDAHAPIIIKGPFLKQKALLDGQDSQPVSGLLIAAAFAPHPITIQVSNPGEKPWIDLTLHWLKRLEIPYSAKGYTDYRLEGRAQVAGFTYLVPGDFSTAAFPLAAALITRSELCLHNIHMDDVQGDKGVISLLEQMGACFEIDEKMKTLKVKKTEELKGIRLDINDCIDALPIMAVIGCFAKGTTEIVNGSIARKKESDRIFCIANELKKMGAWIEERPDGLLIHSSRLYGAKLTAHGDHRIALSLCVAALAADGPSMLCDVDCIKKTYPNFYSDFRAIGAILRQGALDSF